MELLGFIQRVLPKEKLKSSKANRNVLEELSKNVQIEEENIKTEITFDFHRLNVLILRAVMRENFLVARKVGTFTMSDARINASIERAIKIEGSLGGLQVLDLTPEGINHQRVLSIGNDPLTDIDDQNDTIDPIISMSNEVYGIKTKIANEDRRALSFKICRSLDAHVDIKIRMGSVWFIHCARFIQELSWCVSEFKHYLK